MSGQLRFEILGPQRAWYADREIDLGPGKQRAVLAVLLLSAGRPVSTGQIVDAVWPEEPPANGPNVVQKYVAGLRRVLEPDRSPRTPGQVLSLTDAGYLLRVDPEAVDAVRFERGVQAARQQHAAGRTDEALAELATALDLWQGEPFTGFTGPIFEAARQRLVELRAVALETRAELALDLGRHRETVGELVELVAEFPVRERLRQQLMLALYRSGRQAEALAAYREFGDLLREEYGIEPGEALRVLHGRILRADPTLVVAKPATEPAAPPPATVGSVAVVPAQERAADPVDPADPVSAVPPPAPPPAPPSTAFPPMPRGQYPVHGTPPRRARRWVSISTAIVAALIGLLSFGLLTWLVVLVYAVWRRSWRHGLAALGYLSAMAVFIGVVGSGDPDEVTTVDFVAIIAWLFSWLLGVLHTLLLNGAIWSAITGRGTAATGPVAHERRVRREQARYLLYHYPAARQELHIGRPDLPRTFDDGGLVDVNAVPEATIAELPGITAEQARQVVVDRWLRGPFGSMEDLAARCLLPLLLTDSLRDHLVFLPPMPGPSTAIPQQAAARQQTGGDVRPTW
ncbi:BTAD domain-containing putative transcriptional regulator [Micromonospora lupini]|uniref:Transcriptional regulator, SARP family n=1 Tax=Micromonospora lupini str. Lupac 08 TaxID=1150864 RepID=I0LCE7_9ACTN|nr:BTAD domain-containing putative transcriptional regulator [Micromonospora lupini]CCH21494.1 Transcriptional regulator, SARP family [Micromonospora lupini str. Lupac 08]